MLTNITLGITVYTLDPTSNYAIIYGKICEVRYTSNSPIMVSIDNLRYADGHYEFQNPKISMTASIENFFETLKEAEQVKICKERG